MQKDNYMTFSKRQNKEGNCVVCKEKTLNQFGTKEGKVVYCCDYPKNCKLLLHEKRILY